MRSRSHPAPFPLDPRPSDSTDGTRRGTRRDALTVANAALARSRGRALGEGDRRLAGTPHARGDRATYGGGAKALGSRVTANGSTRRLGAAHRALRLGGVHHVRDLGEQVRLLPKTPAMGVRAAVSEDSRERRRPRPTATAASGRHPRARRRVTFRTSMQRSALDPIAEVRAKVIASPTPRRALGTPPTVDRCSRPFPQALVLRHRRGLVAQPRRKRYVDRRTCRHGKGKNSFVAHHTSRRPARRAHASVVSPSSPTTAFPLLVSS